ncbi:MULTISPECIES: hypothetical protein [unclassified Agromyces]|uniref:hypothetical protein n=1 Tax=unclassified Agromyces TaxID=2639701 RepID=UPI003014664B
MHPSDEPGAAPAPRRPERRSPGVRATAALVAVVAVSLAGHQLVASAAYAQAWPLWSAADARYDEATDGHAAAVDRGEAAVDRATGLLEVAAGDLVAADDRAAVEAAVAEAASVVAIRSGGATGIAALTAPDDPAPAWDRYADLWELAELIPDRHRAAERIEDSTVRVAAATRALSDAADALVDGAEATAASVLDASPAAAYRTRAALEAALDDSSGGSGSTVRLTDLATAVTAVRDSHAAEEERRRAHPVRAEIEAFARSIAFGVEIDFAWDYVVGGYSSDGWYSGTAEFFDDGEGWGLVSLSESIEQAWSWDENAKAVVVHEVGHTQVLREACHEIFSGPEFGGDHEAWATAWAIGMGYDVPGSGIDAYGRPSDAQIAAASACR